MFPMVAHIAICVWPQKSGQWFDLGLKARFDVRTFHVIPGKDEPGQHYDLMLIDGDNPGPSFIAHYRAHQAMFGIPWLLVLGQPGCPALMSIEWESERAAFISKPFMIEDVLKTLNSRIDSIIELRTPKTDNLNTAPYGSTKANKKLGYLSTLKLADLIQMLCLSTWTGKIEITNLQSMVSGEVVIHDGFLMHAASGSQIAEQACYTMLNWGRCEFNFNEDIAIPARTIQANWQEVILEGARLLDETPLH